MVVFLFFLKAEYFFDIFQNVTMGLITIAEQMHGNELERMQTAAVGMFNDYTLLMLSVIVI